MDNFTPNPEGIREVYAAVARKIEEIDREIRRDSEGATADEVHARAAERFGATGVNLPDRDLRRYAEAVAAGEPFEFRLQ